MPKVKFTYALKRFFPDLQERQIEAMNLTDALLEVDHLYPGLRSYILDDQGHLRKHVQIFLDGDPIQDRVLLSDQLGPDTEIFLMQALSGG